MTTFSERLRHAMSEAGMTQATLAIKSGAPKSAISQYVAGKNIPGKDRLKALADATGVTVAFLSGECVPVDPPPVLPLTKVSVRNAARCLGKSEQFVRIGLQRGILPFGNAVPGEGKSWNYYINPARFREYVGGQQFDSYFGLSEQ